MMRYIVLFLLISLPVFAENVIFAQPTTTNTPRALGCDGGTLAVHGAQAFVLNSTTQITGVALYVSNWFGYGGESFHITIQNTSGGFPSGIASPYANKTQAFTAGSWTNFTFATAPNVSAGTYALVISPSTWCPGTNANIGMYNGSRKYSYGNTSSKDGSAAWALYPNGMGDLSAGQMAHFVYGNVVTPVIIGTNCTSCNIPLGDTTPPYTTADTTPTFRIQTSVEASCRIGSTNISYASMGSSRDCSGAGSTIHTCTLTSQDEIGVSSTYIYAACAGITDTHPLLMDITGLSETQVSGLDTGIQSSLVWPGSTVYNDQQVFLRNIANTQLLTTVDRVVVYGNQRWLLNFDNQTRLGLFNLTPAVYALDLLGNFSATDIAWRVSDFINSTKQ